MELRIIIVSLACLSCLVPPAVGTGLVAAKALAAIGAAKGAAILGAGALAKGAAVVAAKGVASALAVKGLAALKGLAVKGVAGVASNIAAAKLNAVSSALTPRVTVLEYERPVYYRRPYYVNTFAKIPPIPAQFPAVLCEHLAALASTAAKAVARKASAAGDLIAALSAAKHTVRTPAVYELVEDSQIYPVPIVHKLYGYKK